MGTAKYTRSKSLKDIAQDRVARKYPNLKVINTYWVWGDGRSAWYETILIDPNHPAVKSSL